MRKIDKKAKILKNLLSFTKIRKKEQANLKKIKWNFVTITLIKGIGEQMGTFLTDISYAFNPQDYKRKKRPLSYYINLVAGKVADERARQEQQISNRLTAKFGSERIRRARIK